MIPLSANPLPFTLRPIILKMKQQLILVVLLSILVSSCKQKEALYRIETTAGNITIKLYDKTPLHKDNFNQLVSEHYYDSLLFHRVVYNFMIQTGNAKTRYSQPGEITPDSGEPGYTIAFEFIPEYFHKKGALAAARLNDKENPEKRSSGSQFYIVLGRTYTADELNDLEYAKGIRYTPEQRKVYLTEGGTPHLDYEYTVFGEVIKGMEIIERIAHPAEGLGEWMNSDVRILRIIRE